VREKPKATGIDQAEVIIAVGRGIKQEKDLTIIYDLADALSGVVAATRPLIERGWFDVRMQIGLSGRTVRPRLIITCGISGAIQFVAGMQGAQCIIAINLDPTAPIFKISNYALVGDLYEIIPELVRLIQEERLVLNQQGSAEFKE
jgi:electron transfer flavoprotein alpha subunit